MVGSELCNVVHPCGRVAVEAMQVFATLPRFACAAHGHDMRTKGAKLRPIALGAWVASAVLVDGSTGKAK